MNKNQEKEKRGNEGRNLLLSVLFFLVALIGIVGATTAWLSLADKTRVNSMALEVTAPPNLRFDLDPHESIEDYVSTLHFEQIAARILQEKLFDPSAVKTGTGLQPVTTADCSTFKYKNGQTVSDRSGEYWEFTLHFMASEDMVVHLTSANSTDHNNNENDDGTRITSENAALPQALRISFTDEEAKQTWVYDPGDTGHDAGLNADISVIHLPAASAMKLSNDNAMFSMKALTDKTIIVRIWLEGTDTENQDDLQDSVCQIQLRFAGV